MPNSLLLLLFRVVLKEPHPNVFAAIDRAEQFILRNLRKAAWVNPKTGRREEQYEIPYLAIREAISNAVAHRDYRSSGNIDVAIFDDRIEVWSPGTLPHGVTLRDIRSKKRFSVPRNPVVSEALFLTGYIEKWGSGITKMNTLMTESGLATPEYEECFGGFLVTFQKSQAAISEESERTSKRDVGVHEGEVTPEVTPEVKRLISVMEGEMTRKELQKKLGLKDEKHFREFYQQPGVVSGSIEMTIPDKPKSRLQKYRLTSAGEKLLKQQQKKKAE